MAGICFFLIILPTLLINKYNFNCRKIFEMPLSYLELFEVFIYELVWNFLIIKVLNDLGPFHIVLSNLLLSIVFDFQSSEILGNIYWLLDIVMLLLGFLIYTESIIINVCGLSYNCEINIRKRAEDEF